MNDRSVGVLVHGGPGRGVGRRYSLPQSRTPASRNLGDLLLAGKTALATCVTNAPLSGVSRQGEKPHSYVEILSVVKNGSTKTLAEKSRPLEPLRVVPLPFRKPPFPRPLRFLGNPNYSPRVTRGGSP